MLLVYRRSYMDDDMSDHATQLIRSDASHLSHPGALHPGAVVPHAVQCKHRDIISVLIHRRTLVVIAIRLEPTVLSNITSTPAPYRTVSKSTLRVVSSIRVSAVRLDKGKAHCTTTTRKI